MNVGINRSGDRSEDWAEVVIGRMASNSAISYGAVELEPVSICIICIGTVAAMGSRSGGGGGGPVESATLRQEVGASAFNLYSQGVDLMYAKNFAAAQVKFEQAIRYKPDFAEAHNNLGFTLRQQGPQHLP
jgi:hypothetical protein